MLVSETAPQFFDPHRTGLVFSGEGNRVESGVGQPVGTVFPEVESHPDKTFRDLVDLVYRQFTNHFTSNHEV
jgi:hypothetical protein